VQGEADKFATDEDPVPPRACQGSMRSARSGGRIWPSSLRLRMRSAIVTTRLFHLKTIDSSVWSKLPSTKQASRSLSEQNVPLLGRADSLAQLNFTCLYIQLPTVA
jgi:hypothetical protein